MFLRLFLLIVPLLISVSCSPKRSGALSKINKGYTVDFVKADNLTEVIDFAISENKLVFLDFYADWCLPCKTMDKEVFQDDDLGAFFNEHFISYKVNAEKGSGPDISELYQVSGLPTLIFLDRRGRVLEKKLGIAYFDELMGLAKSAIEKGGATLNDDAIH